MYVSKRTFQTMCDRIRSARMRRHAFTNYENIYSLKNNYLRTTVHTFASFSSSVHAPPLSYPYAVSAMAAVAWRLLGRAVVGRHGD